MENDIVWGITACPVWGLDHMFLGEIVFYFFFFDQIGQFRECQEPLWAKFEAKYRFRQCQGEHTGFSSWLGPHVSPGLVWSC